MHLPLLSSLLQVFLHFHIRLLFKGWSHYQHFHPWAESHTFGVSDKSFGAIFAMLLAIESGEVIRQAVGLLLTQSKVLNKQPGRGRNACVSEEYFKAARPSVHGRNHLIILIIIFYYFFQHLFRYLPFICHSVMYPAKSNQIIIIKSLVNVILELLNMVYFKSLVI